MSTKTVAQKRQEETKRFRDFYVKMMALIDELGEEKDRPYPNEELTDELISDLKSELNRFARGRQKNL